MVGKRVRIQIVVKSTREERIQWLKRKKERNIKTRYKRRKQGRGRKNIINCRISLENKIHFAFIVHNRH